MLAENKHGHGARVRGKIYTKVKRWWRGYGQATLPFDWTKGIVGMPVYNIKNQYEAGSCWGQAFSRLVQILKGGDELSAKSAYSRVYTLPSGTYLPDGEREALELGITTEAKVPSVLNGDSTESFMQDISWVNPTIINDCATRAGLVPVSINIDVDSIAQAIRDYKTVLFLVHGTNNGTWLSPRPTPPTSNTNIWGHYVVADSNIAPNSKEIRFYNSWGTTVGENGFQYFTQDYINSGYLMDVIAFTPFKFNEDLWQGLTSTDVKQLQIRLGVSPQSGYFGPITKAAVIAYQKANGIIQTGYVGPLTRAMLNK